MPFPSPGDLLDPRTKPTATPTAKPTATPTPVRDYSDIELPEIEIPEAAYNPGISTNEAGDIVMPAVPLEGEDGD